MRGIPVPGVPTVYRQHDQPEDSGPPGGGPGCSLVLLAAALALFLFYKCYC
jgi:hypothetical protein